MPEYTGGRVLEMHAMMLSRPRSFRAYAASPPGSDSA